MMSVVRSAHRLAQADPDPRLGRRVDRRGRVVEDQDPRVDHERARDREALALAARERDPALADHRVVALRQPLDELVRLRRAAPRARPPRGQRRRAPKAMLSRTRRREEERILRDDADLAPQRGERHVAHVDAVDRHPAARDVVEARHERRQRRLARSRCARSARSSCRARRRGRRRAAPAGRAGTRTRRPRSGSRPGPAAASPAPGRSAISSGSSIISKIRSPEAVARCAWPIHMPSARSGITSMPR